MDGIALVRLALSVVTERLLVLVAMSMMFTLSIWAIQQCTIERIVLVGVFGILVFIPTILKDKVKPREPDTES